VRFPESGLDLDELFLFEAKRKVQKDRTVSLDAVAYEVDAALVGETVVLRYDPSAPAGRPVQVCHQGQLLGAARPVDLYANCFVKRHRPSWTLSVEGPTPEPPASGLPLRELSDEPEEQR
jgi:putative transposase